MSLPSIFNSRSRKDEDQDKDEKTARQLYQYGIEGMKGHKLPGKIKIKNEKSQIYFENNLNKTKNNFLDIYDKYQRFFKYITNKEMMMILRTEREPEPSNLGHLHQNYYLTG